MDKTRLQDKTLDKYQNSRSKLNLIGGRNVFRYIGNRSNRITRYDDLPRYREFVVKIRRRNAARI